MTRQRISFWTLAAALAAMSFVVSRAVEPEPKSQPATSHVTGDAGEKVNEVRRRGPRLLGNTSCTAAGCHGGVRPEKGIGGEYSLWLQNDPHAKAYSVLFNELSQRMVEQLKSPRPAHQHGYCLSCHSPTANWSPEPATFDGVGCEQCHGPAEQWLEPHVHPKWKSRLMAEKTFLGFRNLHDVSERARTCVKCHTVVKHDLIAAGHPRLFFEMSAFHANLPAHWSRESDWVRHVPGTDADSRQPEQIPASELRLGRSNFEAKLWVSGQLETLHFTVKSLGFRAGHGMKHNPRWPWPELSDWNCFACHHDLKGSSWRQARSSSTLAIGKPGWNSWPITIIDFLPSAGDEKHVQAARESIGQLRDLMSRPYPLPNAVYETARATQDHMTYWITSWMNQNMRGMAISRELIDDWLRQMSGGEGQKLIAENWDSATQVYLGLSALTPAAHDARSDVMPNDERHQARLAILGSMNQSLNFPDGFNSPRTFAAEQIERLKRDLKRFRETLEEGKR
jgi:cytochrome c554/c'-like protein